MKAIMVRGAGARAEQLQQRLHQAAQELGLDYELVCDTACDSVKCPIFELNGVVKSELRLPQLSELKDILCGLDAMPKCPGGACCV